MPGYKPSVIPAITVSGVAVVGAIETIVITLPGVSTPGPGAEVILQGVIDLTAGTGATTVFVTVYRGVDTSGVKLAQQPGVNVAGGSRYLLPVFATDLPPDEAGASYTVTVLQLSATANGTAVLASLGGIVS